MAANIARMHLGERAQVTVTSTGPNGEPFRMEWELENPWLDGNQDTQTLKLGGVARHIIINGRPIMP